MKERWLCSGLGFLAGIGLMFAPLILARGDATRARAALDHAQRMSVDLAALHDPGGALPLPAAVRLPTGGVTLIDASGTVRLQRTAAAGSVLLIPAGALAPGKYTLRTESGADAGLEILR